MFHSYSQAIAVGAPWYFTGEPCCNGHIDKRYTKGRQCYGCVKAYRKQAVIKSRRKEYMATYSRDYYARNKTCIDTVNRKWSVGHRCACAKISAKWRREHRSRWAAIQAEHRAKKSQATPAWANTEAIRKIYDDAAQVTKETGVQHHVDHIYPLNSDWVCGLHVETNLRVITAQENTKKRNRKIEGLHQ